MPASSTKAGIYLGVSLVPGKRSAGGQVIVFGRNVDTKVVLWRSNGPNSWACWLAGVADGLKANETFEFAGICANGSNGEDKDNISHGGYYYNGAGCGHSNLGGNSGNSGLQLVGQHRNWDVLQA
jgi:hypothetical protein